MSRLIRFHQFGPAEVLRLEEQPLRAPAAGEVHVRVEAVGVNWFDVLWRQDLAPQHARLPAGLGSELAGEVLAVGAGVERLQVGDKVASFPGHSINDYPAYADEVLLPATSLVRYPDVLTPLEASVHYLPSLLAYFAFRELGRLQPGQRVLVTEAALCCGPSSVQLAKALGAEVYATTADAADRDLLRERGADRVIVTEEEDLVGRIARLTDGQGVDIVLDACGGPQMALLGDVMAPCGKLILYGLNGGNQTQFPACAAFEKNFKFFVHCLRDFTGDPEMGISQDREALLRALEDINQLTRDGLLRPLLTRVFPFEQFREAHRFVESACRGRVALQVTPAGAA
jgi:NADPH:quinone reductase-like Zn-dependent oxidoreductase